MNTRQTIVAPPPALLEFRFASFPGAEPGGGYERINLTLRSGELVLIWHPRGPASPVLAQAAQGWAAPSRGSVWFEGQDWAKVAGRNAAKLRAATGRVYNRDSVADPERKVRDRILQRVRLQPWRNRKALTAEAEALAARLGFSGLPPDEAGDGTSPGPQAAQWLRALAGRPRLLILEWPLQDAAADRLPVFFDELAAARARGAGVLWFTDGDEWPRAIHVPVSQQFEDAGHTLRPRDG